jgi:Ca2+-binding RTX toxin-like protein
MTSSTFLYGEDDADTLYGDRNGRDEGRDGADELYGGGDADKLYGEGGNDLVDGADDMTADAVLSGGEGAHDRCLASFGDSPSIDCELFS